ncbi:unnamed protein product [Peronospora farinosa]|uniref:RxLR effector protein n=1 Tax=Peronospora farinosa TaxID=134698 RepID=A0ABN8C5N8_9STRA|nr:unnamed protein product [Peronospora farinosa]
MRLDSLFFVALLFACFNTSSTRSISTSMGSVTPSQKDVPTHEVGVKTTIEERTFNVPGFDKAIEGVLQLHKDNSIRLRNERYNAWIRYLAKAPPATELAITKFLKRHGGRIDDCAADFLEKRG